MPKMEHKMRPTEALLKSGTPLKEVELMLTIEELQEYAKYCQENHIKFNDWIRELASEALLKEKNRENCS